MYYIQIQIENKSSSRNRETCLQKKKTSEKNSATHRILRIYRMLILCPQTRSVFVKKNEAVYFEDNEAVIKMICKGRSPNLRHDSRTHRVALDWLLDGINLDPKIRIWCVVSKNQFADTLTKGHFTRDEWNHLLCVFNISLFQFSKLR